MPAKQKSVRNYIFLSNALMVLLVLGIFLILNALVIKLYEYRGNGNIPTNSEVAMGSYEASMLLESYDWQQIDDTPESLRELCSDLEKFGFLIYVEQNGNLLFTNIADVTAGEVEEMESFFLRTGAAIYM
ncbi:MAG: hypothetical protein LUF68_02020 [Clostridiales bacterium]|nr:hypothetical protein [Clostridiales bacterium]